MKKPALIAVLVAGGACLLCSGLSVVLLAAGAMDDDASPGEATSTTAAQPPRGELAGFIVGKWTRNAKRVCEIADVGCRMGDPGTIRRRWQFNADGTWSYDAEFLPVGPVLTFEHEAGTWRLDGDRLTLVSEELHWEQRKPNDGALRNGGPLIAEGTRPEETVTYQVRKHYFPGIDEWNLVLTPAAITRRDGPFSSNSDFPTSYLLSPER